MTAEINISSSNPIGGRVFRDKIGTRFPEDHALKFAEISSRHPVHCVRVAVHPKRSAARITFRVHCGASIT